jgi:cellobiose-specific phosphotransferase system component IIA
MKRFLKKLEGTFAAVAFAEAGEFETAKEILKEDEALTTKVKTLKDKVEVTVDNLISMAITIAEAGEVEKAKSLLKEAENSLDEVEKDLQYEFDVYSGSSA